MNHKILHSVAVAKLVKNLAGPVDVIESPVSKVEERESSLLQFQETSWV